MLRNVSRSLLVLGAALLAFAPGLSAQTGGTPVRGDVDGDGRVTPADAAIVTSYLVGRTVPAGVDINRADVNGDGRVTAADAAIITAFAAGRDVKRFPVGTPITVVPKGLASIACSGDVRNRTVTCGGPSQLPGGARGLLVGGQHKYVDVTSSNLAVTPTAGGDQFNFSFDVTIKNLMTQTLGTTDGTNLDPEGVRIFFAPAPVVTAGSGSVEVTNATSGIVTATNQLYYQYNQMLPTGATSAAQNWHFLVDTTVAHFDFVLYVSARVQHEEGSVVILAPNTLETGDTVTLADSVLYANGSADSTSFVRWSSSDTTLAQVDSMTGAVLGVGEGTVTLTGKSPGPSPGGRPGTATANRSLLVRSPAPYSKITASPSTLAAGDTTTITVQLKNSAGNNIHHPAGPVVLSTGAGATLSPVTDNHDGTYTAKLTSTTAGVYAVAGTLRGVEIGDTAHATFGAAAAAHLNATSLTPQNGAVGAAVGTPPAVHVTDQFGNSVQGATVTFTVTGGGGTLTLPTPPSGVGGIATVGSWTLGGSGLNTLQATVTGVPDTARFTAYVAPVAGVDSSEAVGNFTLPLSVGGDVRTNDNSQNGGTIVLADSGQFTTVRGGTLQLGSNGNFTYTPPAGITGRDSVQYAIKDGLYSGPNATGWLKFRFVSRVWFVDNASGASPDGRDTNPFTSISGAEAVAGTGETILVRTGSGTTTGGTLKDGQSVNGQNPTTPVTLTLAMLNGSQQVTLLATGASPTIGALTLGSGNTLQNFTSAGGITGSAFGTLTVAQVGINNPSGQALSLTNGTLSGGFTSLISGGGTNNVLLSGVSTPSTQTMGASGNALSGATGDAVVITGGTGSFTFPGNVSNATSFAVNVNGKSGGAVTFSGTINPGAAARGISVASNTGGSVTFSGAQNISSGTAAGVNLTTNTGATISFTGGALAIATTTGTPFTATGGGTVEVTGGSNTISATGAAARAVDLNGITIGANGIGFSSISSSGSTTSSAFRANSVGNTSGSAFTAGSLTVAGTTGASSRGLELTSNSAPFTFTTVSVNGTGGEGVYLTGNTGAVALNGGTVGNTSNTTGDAFFVSGGNAGITMAASLTKSSAGRVANIGSHSAGAVTVSGALSCTGSCTGINVASNSGGTIDFSSATQTLNTGASAAVTLSSNTGATINFSGGSLAITTGAGAGINATGGGTMTVTGANNTVNSSGGGTAVTVSSTTIGGSGMTFKRIDATGSGTNGIVLSSTGAGAFTVTGDGASDPNNTTRGRTTAKGGGGTLTLGSGGSISGRSGQGVSLSSTGAVTLRNMVITGSGSSGDGINASSTGRLTIDNTRITGAAVAHGLWGSSVSGLAIQHSEIDNNATTAGVVEGPDIWNVRILGLSGTDSITNSNIHHSQEDVLGILNSSGTLNLTVSNTNITDTGTGAGGTTAFALSADGTANVTVNMQNDSINRGRARGVDFGTGTSSSAVFNTTINNSQFMQNGAAISIVQGSSGTNTFNITNNNLQSNDANSLQAMIINRAGSPSFNSFGLFTGTISNNTIGTAGVANSGSGTSNGIDVKSSGSGGITRVAIVSNTIHRVGLHGISVAESDANTGGTTQPLLEARIASNTISVETATGLDGINILPGALSTDDETMCIDIANNNSTGIRNGLRVRPSGLPAAPSTVQLEGWDGSTAVNTYFTSRPNTLAGGTAAISTSAPPSPGGFVAVAACNTP